MRGNLTEFNINLTRVGNRLPEMVTTDTLRSVLGRTFRIQEQVYGRHFSTPRRKRIDMVIYPLDTSDWSNKQVAFGVEVKRDDFHCETGTGDYCRHFGQSVDYANTEWDGFGYLNILTYPSFIPQRISDPEFYRRIAGRLGVGELCFTEYGLTAFLNGHNIWCQSLGVVEGKTWGLKRKFGSR